MIKINELTKILDECENELESYAREVNERQKLLTRLKDVHQSALDTAEEETRVNNEIDKILEDLTGGMKKTEAKPVEKSATGTDLTFLNRIAVDVVNHLLDKAEGNNLTDAELNYVLQQVCSTESTAMALRLLKKS
jgi:hypothetical protein